MSCTDKVRGMLATHDTPPLVHADRDDDGMFWVGWTIRHKGGIREEIRIASGMPEFVAEFLQAQIVMLTPAS
jgi:hypothetical protein